MDSTGFGLVLITNNVTEDRESVVHNQLSITVVPPTAAKGCVFFLLVTRDRPLLVAIVILHAILINDFSEEAAIFAVQRIICIPPW
jgi:hypothetical protein